MKCIKGFNRPNYEYCPFWDKASDICKNPCILLVELANADLRQKYDTACALQQQGQEEIADLQRRLDSFWEELPRRWEIEDRTYFESEAPGSGDWTPEQMALHHVWKRDVKVADIQARLAAADTEIKRLTSEMRVHCLDAELAEQKTRKAEERCRVLGIAIIKAHAALICGDLDEVAHALYGGANPGFDSLLPYAELEKLTGTTVGGEVEFLKAAALSQKEGAAVAEKEREKP